MTAEDEKFDSDPAVQRSLAFLHHWHTLNFGELGTYPLLNGASRRTRGAAAQHARDRFRGQQLGSYGLLSVDHTMPSVAELTGWAVVNGERSSLNLRWIYQADDGDYVVPPRPGEWRLQHWEPVDLLTPTTQLS